MADTKISALTAATTPLAGTEVVPLVQSGVTKKASVANLTLGRSISAKDLSITDGNVDLSKNGTSFQWSAAGNFVAINATSGALDFYTGTGTYNKNASLSPTGNYTLANGNLAFGTTAKGINFTANTPAAGMTSQLLNWYEEGTFTATRTGFTEVLGGGTITSTGVYTRVGRMVTIQIILTCTGAATIEGIGGAASYFSIPYAAGQNTPGSWVNNTLFNTTGAMVASGANLFVVTGWAASGNERVFTATYSV